MIAGQRGRGGRIEALRSAIAAFAGAGERSSASRATSESRIGLRMAPPRLPLLPFLPFFLPFFFFFTHLPFFLTLFLGQTRTLPSVVLPGALDVRRRRRFGAGAVALVGGRQGTLGGSLKKPPSDAGVVDLHQRAVVVFIGGERVVGEEEDVDAVGRGRQEAGVEGTDAGGDQLRPAARPTRRRPCGRWRR